MSTHWESYDNPARGGPQSGVVGLDGLFGCGFGQWNSECLLGFMGEQIPDDENTEHEDNGGRLKGTLKEIRQRRGRSRAIAPTLVVATTRPRQQCARHPRQSKRRPRQQGRHRYRSSRGMGHFPPTLVLRRERLRSKSLWPRETKNYRKEGEPGRNQPHPARRTSSRGACAGHDASRVLPHATVGLTFG